MSKLSHTARKVLTYILLAAVLSGGQSFGGVAYINIHNFGNCVGVNPNWIVMWVDTGGTIGSCGARGAVAGGVAAETAWASGAVAGGMYRLVGCGANGSVTVVPGADVQADGSGDVHLDGYYFVNSCPPAGYGTNAPTATNWCVTMTFNNTGTNSCSYWGVGSVDGKRTQTITVAGGGSETGRFCFVSPQDFQLWHQCGSGPPDKFGDVDDTGVTWQPPDVGDDTGGGVTVNDDGSSGDGGGGVVVDPLPRDVDPRVSDPGVTNIVDVSKGGFTTLHNDLVSLGVTIGGFFGALTNLAGLTNAPAGTNVFVTNTNLNQEKTQIGVSNLLSQLVNAETNRATGTDWPSNNYSDVLAVSNNIKGSLGVYLGSNAVLAASVTNGGYALVSESAHSLLQIELPAAGIMAATTLDLDPLTNSQWSPLFSRLNGLFSWLLTLTFTGALFYVLRRKVEVAVTVPQRVATSLVGRVPVLNLVTSSAIAALIFGVIGAFLLFGVQYFASHGMAFDLSGAQFASGPSSPTWWIIAVHYLTALFPVAQFFGQLSVWWGFFFIVEGTWLVVVGLVSAITA